MTKRKALGSGLEALLSSKLDKKSEKEVDNFANSNQRVLSIPIDKITRNKISQDKYFSMKRLIQWQLLSKRMDNYPQ